MITYRTTGKELEKELEKEFKVIQKEQKKRRDKMRKGFRGKELPYMEESWTWISRPGGYNKWFIKTSVEGKPDKPKVTAHSHVVSVTSSGANRYIIPRGYKPRPDKKIGGYVVSLEASTVNEIKELLGLEEEQHNSIVSRIFKYLEKSIYLPCEWSMDDEEEKQEEKPEGYIPTTDEIWAEYDAMMKVPRKQRKNRYEGLGQLILKTSLGFFLGYIREQKEIILDVFMREEDFEGESKNKIETIINPAYELYNTNNKERIKEIEDFLKESLTRDEKVYVLYP